MNKNFPYLAIDVETTGLDTDRSQILQIAAIYDDGSSPIENLQRFNEIIWRRSFDYSEPVAMAMNADLVRRTYLGSGLTLVQDKWEAFIQGLLAPAGVNAGKLHAAGKNAAGFDLPVLRSNGFSTAAFKHRVLDVGTLYAHEFDHVPSFDEIAAHLNLGEVAHDALADCEMVVHAIRAFRGQA